MPRISIVVPVHNVEKYLEQNNIKGFDVMFLTHAHDDHVNGAVKHLKSV